MASIKRFLPRTLLGRSLLILVVPLILLQLVSTYIFYERHWDTITRRLATAIAGDIGLIIDHMGRYPDAESREWVFEDAWQKMTLRIDLKEGEILPNKPAQSYSGQLDRRLADALIERVQRPFLIDTGFDEDWIKIEVQLADGVLEVFAPRKRLFSSTTYIFIMWMVGTSMVLLAVATIFMRNQVRPIRRLAAAADGFGKGRPVPDFKLAGALEVRQAAAAFKLMYARIQRQIAQRTEMLAGVSHDLKTVLTRMKLQLAMTKDSPELESLSEDVTEMERILGEYLAFASGEGTEAAVDTDLPALLAEVAEGARRNGADVTLETEDGVTVPLRPNAFRRCVSNLVANATRHGEHVWISAARQGDSVEITIDDDGPGIPPDQREEVFKPFYRVDRSRNPETGGIGLGLTIARDVLRSHGGDIVLGQAPRGGLRARLRVPV